MQQPYLSSSPDAGGVPPQHRKDHPSDQQAPHERYIAPGQQDPHAGVHVPWRSVTRTSLQKEPRSKQQLTQTRPLEVLPVTPRDTTGAGSTVLPVSPISDSSGASAMVERTFKVPHPVLSIFSWVIALASATWLAFLGISLTLLVASGISHDSELMMLTYGVYMACAFGFCCFGVFCALHFGLGSNGHWRDSVRHPQHPH